MKKLFFLIVLFLPSCSIDNKNQISNINLKFSDKLTLDEFRLKLEQYAENSEYPNIDN
tara:strand:+ start:4556 stop:4729 length:174 start_codon:yes stop_codon:yes gene_type:complete